MRLRLPFSPRHLALIPISALMLLPLVWMLLTSVETLPEARHFPPQLIPSGERRISVPTTSPNGLMGAEAMRFSPAKARAQ